VRCPLTARDLIGAAIFRVSIRVHSTAFFCLFFGFFGFFGFFSVIRIIVNTISSTSFVLLVCVRREEQQTTTTTKKKKKKKSSSCDPIGFGVCAPPSAHSFVCDPLARFLLPFWRLFLRRRRSSSLIIRIRRRFLPLLNGTHIHSFAVDLTRSHSSSSSSSSSLSSSLSSTLPVLLLLLQLLFIRIRIRIHSPPHHSCSCQSVAPRHACATDRACTCLAK
jgi:hypothetical protein